MTIQQQIWDFIQLKSGASRNMLHEQFSELTSRQLSNALYRMIDQGYLTRTDDGVYFTDKPIATTAATEQEEPAQEEPATTDTFDQVIESLPESVYCSRSKGRQEAWDLSMMRPSQTLTAVDLLEHRAKTFNNRKILVGGTPTVKGLSRVEDAYKKSDQHIFWVACYECGDVHALSWDNVIWDENADTHDEIFGNAQPETARYACPHCYSLQAFEKMPEEMKKHVLSKVGVTFTDAQKQSIQQLQDDVGDEDHHVTAPLMGSSDPDDDGLIDIRDARIQAMEALLRSRDDEIAALRAQLSLLTEASSQPHAALWQLLKDLPFDTKLVATRDEVPYVWVPGFSHPVELPSDGWQDAVEAIQHVSALMIETEVA